ncbi:palmitoyltransferase ZDHHC22-like [Lineus longissimus]|uniref:palmitoyltransferase ZDHHC22-like n=1 Tax=Lineus longissimus TaxID=88925 RepID=UPI00315C9897
METGGLRNRDLSPSLKDKLKAHYDTRGKIFEGPRLETAGTIGATFLWCQTVGLVLISIFIIFPELYPEDHVNMSGFILFLFAEIAVNWVLAARMKPSVYTGDRQENGSSSTMSNNNAILHPPNQGALMTRTDDWSYCLHCQQDAPPRSHHCKVCQCCIMKRDHHCFFTNSCIGHFNQRYFIVHVFYVAIGTACCLYWLGAYLDKFVPFLSSDIVAYIPLVQIVMFFLGKISLLNMLLIILLYLTLFCCVCGTGFFLWEMAVVVSGQTSYEAWKLIRKYKCGSLFARLRAVFGPFWLLSFIIPLPVKQPGDGIHWELAKATKRW